MTFRSRQSSWIALCTAGENRGTPPALTGNVSSESADTDVRETNWCDRFCCYCHSYGAGFSFLISCETTKQRAALWHPTPALSALVSSLSRADPIPFFFCNPRPAGDGGPHDGPGQDSGGSPGDDRPNGGKAAASHRRGRSADDPVDGPQAQGASAGKRDAVVFWSRGGIDKRISQSCTRFVGAGFYPLQVPHNIADLCHRLRARRVERVWVGLNVIFFPTSRCSGEQVSRELFRHLLQEPDHLRCATTRHFHR